MIYMSCTVYPHLEPFQFNSMSLQFTPSSESSAYCPFANAQQLNLHNNSRAKDLLASASSKDSDGEAVSTESCS